jgi:hypothetical protein
MLSEVEPELDQVQQRQEDTIGHYQSQKQDTVSQCGSEFPVFESPMGQTSNYLLWGNWDMDEYGLLLYPLQDSLDNGGDAHSPLFLKKEQD